MAVTTKGTTKDARAPQGWLQQMVARRVADAMPADSPNEQFMRYFQNRVWNFLCDHYFRLEMDGWHRIPDEPSLLIGIHSSGSLTMDAWTLVHAWSRRIEGRRILHGAAHDVLMASPVLGDYSKAVGVIPASRQGATAALGAGHDVVVWPGGEQDAMRHWRHRDKAMLFGRKGFVRQAIRSGVPIVPVATVGGRDTVFELSEGRFIARCRCPQRFAPSSWTRFASTPTRRAPTTPRTSTKFATRSRPRSKRAWSVGQTPQLPGAGVSGNAPTHQSRCAIPRR